MSMFVHESFLDSQELQSGITSISHLSAPISPIDEFSGSPISSEAEQTRESIRPEFLENNFVGDFVDEDFSTQNINCNFERSQSVDIKHPYPGLTSGGLHGASSDLLWGNSTCTILTPTHTSPDLISTSKVRKPSPPPIMGIKKITKGKTKVSKVKVAPRFLSPELPSEEILRTLSHEEFQKYWIKLKDYPTQDQERLRLIKRRIKNRESASASRLRKKTYCEVLEKKTAELEQEKKGCNEQLQQLQQECAMLRQHANDMYLFAKRHHLDFDSSIEQQHTTLGFPTRLVNDIDGFLLDTNTGESKTAVVNSDETRHRVQDSAKLFGSTATKFSLLSVFAVATLVLCISSTNQNGGPPGSSANSHGLNHIGKANSSLHETKNSSVVQQFPATLTSTSIGTIIDSLINPDGTADLERVINTLKSADPSIIPEKVYDYLHHNKVQHKEMHRQPSPTAITKTSSGELVSFEENPVNDYLSSDYEVGKNINYEPTSSELNSQKIKDQMHVDAEIEKEKMELEKDCEDAIKNVIDGSFPSKLNTTTDDLSPTLGSNIVQKLNGAVPTSGNFAHVETFLNESILRRALPNAKRIPYFVAQRYTILGPSIPSIGINDNSTIGIVLPETPNRFIELIVNVANGKEVFINH